MSATRQMRRHQERMARKGRVVPSFEPNEAAPATRRPVLDSADGQLIECALIRGGEIHHGFKSHSDLRASLGDKDPYTAKPEDEYGFWTSRGLFVSRRAAVPVAIAAGQLDESWRSIRRDLLSADLDW